MAAALAVVAVVFLVAGWGRRDKDEAVSGTFTRLTDLEGSETFPSLSPDGTYFLYSKSEGGHADIYLQRVGGGNPIDLTADSPSDDTQAAFSADGLQIAFRSERAGGGIFLMGATGESVRRLTGFGYNPAWSPDSREVLVATEGVTSPDVRLLKSEVWRVDVATGARRRVLRGDAVQPSWSPHGWRIAYWGLPAGSGQRVIWTSPAAGDPRGGKPVRVTSDAYLNWDPVWSPDGRYLYYASDRSGSMNLWRVPIDERSGEVRGAPEPVTTPAPWSGFLSFSRDGRRLVYATREGRSNLERTSLAGGQAGALLPVTRGTRAVRSGDVSPDGRWIVFNTASPQQDLFVVQADGTGLRQLTNDAFKDRSPLWSFDGRRILFYSNRSGRYEAWAIRPDGSGLEPLTRTPGSYVTSPIGSPDGRRLVCTLGSGGSALIDLDLPLARRVPRPLPPLSPAGEVFLATSWSPDGAALVGTAQRSDESAFPGIFLYRFDTGRYMRLMANGDTAVWLRDGRTVLVQDRGKILAVDPGARGSRVVAGAPPHSTFNSVSATADGRTLFLVRATDEGDVWRLDLD
jgi:Tol biopolymer transport system component